LLWSPVDRTDTTVSTALIAAISSSPLCNTWSLKELVTALSSAGKSGRDRAGEHRGGGARPLQRFKMSIGYNRPTKLDWLNQSSIESENFGIATT